MPFLKISFIVNKLDWNKLELRLGLEPFGSMCFAYVQNKSNLDDRAQEGVFVGYDTHSPSYLVYFRSNGVVRKVRWVKFPSMTCDLDDDLVLDLNPATVSQSAEYVLHLPIFQFWPIFSTS